MSLEWKIDKYAGNKSGYKLLNKYRVFMTALQIDDLKEISIEINKILDKEQKI